MNLLSSLMPAQNQMRSPLSDEELQRLAAMLQEKGEGLAAINPKEAQMLKDAGGSGKALPGTMGLGVGGGPIRSYETTPGSDDDNGDDDNGGYTPSASDYSQGTTSSNPTGGTFSTSGGNNNNNNNRNNDDNRPPPPPPKPTYGPDDDGGMHFTKAELDAANKRIRLKKAGEDLAAEAKTFTSDQTFDRWYAANKSKYEGVSEEEIKKLFENEMQAVRYEGVAQSAQLKERIVDKFNRRFFTASNEFERKADGTIEEKIPTTFTEADAVLLKEFPDDYGRLSLQQRRALFDAAVNDFTRQNRFTLTAEELERFQRAAPTVDAVDDMQAPQITETPQADTVTVGEIDPAGRTEIVFTPDVERDYIDKIRKNENELVDILKRRVAGEAPSPAELQLNQQTEKNVRLLMGSIAGAQADPGKRRQLSQIFADVQQVAVGQAAELRSQEQIAAENRLVQLYQQQGTQEVSIALAKLSAEKEKAFLQGNLDQAREIAIMESNMTRVATQASLDRDVRLANLETKKNLLIKNGDYALATRMQNLQKEIVISTTNAEIALKSRSMDDALAMAQFMADQGLEGLEVQINLAEMDADLKKELAKLGFDTQEKIAALDRNARMVIAEMNSALARAQNNQSERNALIGAVSVVVSKIVMSDRRAKKKIKPAKTKAQEFLDSLKAYSYEYKDPNQPGAKQGEMLGIMAQDLEKTSLGKQMVLDTPTGKMVDMGQGLAALLASQAYLNDQVKNLAARI